MKGKLEELDEPVDDLMEVSKVQTQILNLTGNQVDIIDQQTGGFKSTYKILEEISKVWDSLNDQRRSALLEILAGKNRANIGAALIQAFQSGQIQKALEDAGDAAGTATEEYSRMMSGIQAQFDEFKGALEELSNEFIKSNFIKDIVNGGTALIRLLTTLTEKFGTLTVVLTPILTFIGAKYSLNFFSAICNGVKNIIVAMNGLTTSTGAAADALLGLRGALTGLAIGAGVGLATLLIGKILNSAREAKEAADELRSESKANAEEYRQEEEALDDVVSKYVEAISSTQTYAEKKEELLNIQNQLPDTYKDEANGIDLVNGKIEENIKLLDEQRKKKAEEYVQSNQGGYEQALKELGVSKNIIGAKKSYRNEIQDFVGRNLNKRLGKIGVDSLGNYFAEGTLEERISTLERIRNLYAQEKGHKTEILSQLDTEISDYKTILKTNQDIVSEMDKQKGIISISEQEYNMIDQAMIAYSEYQKALNEDDNIGMSNALKALESIKETVYSVTDSGSALRTEFDEVWDSFKFGGGEVLEGIREVQEKFAEITDKAFSEELGNIDAIDKAIESLLEGKNLSHDDAWKLLNLDTEGTLKDIRVINGEYKLSTEELAKLADQRIQKQKEVIAALKAAAEAQLAEDQRELSRLKINSLSDAKYYAATIQSINEDIKTARDIIKQSGLLLGELNGRLVKTEMLTSQTSTQLNSAIEAFENEIEAIEDSIDALNDRKDALNDEKEALQEELDLLNEQKEAIEQTLKNYDAVADAVNSYVEAQKDGIQERIDALEEEQKSIEDYYNSQIDALKEQNEERDDAIKKEKALADLANAENQKKRIYSSARGWEYLSSKEDIVNAQNALAEIENDQKIKKLEKERDAKLGGFDERKKEYETQIKAFEEYAKKYSNIASDIQEAENALLADQILGSDWRVKIEETDEGLLQKYRSEYQSFNNQLKTLVNTEITNLQASIDMKDREIKKIDKEIEAYNKYKTTVQKNLKDAQDALETYKNSVDNAKNDVIGDMATMETETWYKTSDCKRWWNELAGAVEDSKNRICNAYNDIGNGAAQLADRLRNSSTGYGIINSAGDAALLEKLRQMGYYADGGVNNYTGLAMLHGTAQNPETIFNAKDSAKLYELVHNTPNIMASMVSQASQLIPNLTNTNNNTANSINVNIGQVVANNPMELTRNLDTHLDSYFRRKLTQGYVQ